MSSQPLLPDGPAGDDAGPLGAACRVCHGDGSGEDDPLISPCQCDGSVRWVHRSCLNAWRARGAYPQSVARCELCHAAYVFELRKMPVGHVAVYIVWCAFGSSLPLAAACMLLGVVTSRQVGLLGFLVVVGLWALHDAALSLANDWQGGGVLGEAMHWLSIAAMPPGPAADAAAERAAQALAAKHSQARARAAVVAQEAADEEAARLRQAPPRIGLLSMLPGQSAGAGTAPVGEAVGVAGGAGEREEDAWREGADEPLCCSLVCCLQTTAFLATPPLLTGAWAALCRLIGMKGVKYGAWALAGVGGTYWPLVGALTLAAAARRAPLCAVCGSDGLPIVRCRSKAGTGADLSS